MVGRAEALSRRAGTWPAILHPSQSAFIDLRRFVCAALGLSHSFMPKHQHDKPSYKNQNAPKRKEMPVRECSPGTDQAPGNIEEPQIPDEVRTPLQFRGVQVARIRASAVLPSGFGMRVQDGVQNSS